MMKRNDGFTMVELLITIVAAAVVTIAAASLILLGTRIQHASTADASEQQTVRIVMNLLEKMAGSGEIRQVKNSYTGWTLTGETDADVLFEYVAAEQALYNGPKGNGAVLLDGLNGAGARMEDSLLHFTFNTVRGGSYETAIWCRTSVTSSSDVTVENKGTNDARRGFLEVLIGQYANGGNGPNTGKIVETGLETDQYYSQWYSRAKMNIDWPANTPWCACYLSWAAVKTGIISLEEGSLTADYCFANVDTGIEVFKEADAARSNAWKEAEETPEPGDYVFFDWSGGEDPSHIGVVLNVITDGETGKTTIYTIEGNSGGVIAVRQYSNTSNVIIGYGSLPFDGDT